MISSSNKSTKHVSSRNLLLIFLGRGGGVLDPPNNKQLSTSKTIILLSVFFFSPNKKKGVKKNNNPRKKKKLLDAIHYSIVFSSLTHNTVEIIQKNGADMLKEEQGGIKQMSQSGHFSQFSLVYCQVDGGGGSIFFCYRPIVIILSDQNRNGPHSQLLASILICSLARVAILLVEITMTFVKKCLMIMISHSLCSAIIKQAYRHITSHLRNGQFKFKGRNGREKHALQFASINLIGDFIGQNLFCISTFLNDSFLHISFLPEINC